jgi:hypothetical protein
MPDYRCKDLTKMDKKIIASSVFKENKKPAIAGFLCESS